MAPRKIQSFWQKDVSRKCSFGECIREPTDQAIDFVHSNWSGLEVAEGTQIWGALTSTQQIDQMGRKSFL